MDSSSVPDSFLAELASTASLDAGFPPGHVIGGQYRVMRRIGAGGMGVVYHAVDLLLHREVAVKVLGAARATNRGARERLVREARICAAIHHPNVVTIFDGGIDGEHVFFAMELVSSGSLRALLARGRLETSRAIEIARAVATGLAAVHARGTVHRDLKPENVLLDPHVGAKVSDFGIAKPAVDDGGEARPGAPVGTVGYMSPEQAEGADVDESTDVFSFGVVLHELLTGTRPFSARTPGEFLVEIATKPVVRVPDVEREVGRLVVRCLARDPRARPALAEVTRTLAETGTRRRSLPPIALAAFFAFAFAVVVHIATRPRVEAAAAAPGTTGSSHASVETAPPMAVAPDASMSAAVASPRPAEHAPAGPSALRSPPGVAAPRAKPAGATKGTSAPSAAAAAPAPTALTPNVFGPVEHQPVGIVDEPPF